MTYRTIRIASLFVVVSAVLSACAGCPGKAGDPCDAAATDDPCPDGLVCQPGAEADDPALCRIVVGEKCTPSGGLQQPDAAADEAFCADGTSCTGEGDEAICGGLHSSCRRDGADEPCAGDFACEELEGRSDGQCEKPLRLIGKVVDAQTGDPVPEAHVIALDEQGTALARIAITNSDGDYSLAVPAKRKADGSPVDEIVTLRSSARDYMTFPGGLRTALPIHLDDAAEGEDSWAIENALTTIGLLELPEAQQGRALVQGKVAAGVGSAGVLVVAEGAEVATAVSDLDGEFTIFNVAAGTYTLRGYAKGVQLEPEQLEVDDDDVEGVDLRLADRETATMTGTVQIVNAPGGSVTSIVLVVDSTFDDLFLRGESPRGLRTALDVSGAWTIDGVPDGEYVVLAAFENDDLVRDPDENIAGTDLVRVTVSGGAAVDVEQSFKITEALDVVSPGADAPEAVTGTPTFVFQDDSSEDAYELEVWNAFGDLVWETSTAGVSGSDDVSIAYGGPALEAGMYYQFRARSIRGTSPISMTEDLKGVFFVPAE